MEEVRSTIVCVFYLPGSFLVYAPYCFCFVLFVEWVVVIRSTPYVLANIDMLCAFA